MENNSRRDNLITLLKTRQEPITGTQLSKILGVSRQAIVQDIALLRASDYDIISTTKGYILHQPKEDRHVRRLLRVKHTTAQIEDELCTIVDHGGKLLDVVVSHEIYGTISTPLIVKNRVDAYDFVKKVHENQVVPLKDLTLGVHSHTVEADSEETLDRIEQALRDKGYLC